MTIQELFNEIDNIKPNAFSTATKIKWLNEIEGKIQTDVFILAPEEIVIYDDDTKLDDCELLVEPPHDKLYEPYITARMDFSLGEYEKYQNEKAMFDAFYNEFVCFFARTYRPADQKRR